MPTLIPRTTIIRRPAPSKRWHIRDTQASIGVRRTMCGQIFGLKSIVNTTTRAETITCDDCLVSAISKGRPN